MRERIHWKHLILQSLFSTVTSRSLLSLISPPPLLYTLGPSGALKSSSQQGLNVCRKEETKLGWLQSVLSPVTRGTYEG